jgi:hypothetical protein
MLSTKGSELVIGDALVNVLNYTLYYKISRSEVQINCGSKNATCTFTILCTKSGIHINIFYQLIFYSWSMLAIEDKILMAKSHGHF